MQRTLAGKGDDVYATAIFCNAIREYAKSIGKDNFFLFGEVVDNDEMIQRYIAQNTPVEGVEERYPLLDACLDFPLYFVLDEVIKGEAFVLYIKVYLVYVFAFSVLK